MGTTPAGVAPQRTALFGWHAGNGASMQEFGGYQMPIQYTSVLGEHLATRAAAGLFDVSHMGRFLLRGARALPFLRRALTNDAARLPETGWAQYTLLADDQGGALDDAFLYRLAPEEFMLVVNAANRARDWGCLQQLAGQWPGLELLDGTDELAMVALQGPVAEVVLSELLAACGSGSLPPRRRNALARVRVAGAPVVVARTGYTGEPVSLELFPPVSQVMALWEQLVAIGREAGVRPVGLGARDTLRLEAGLPLYGHELGPGPDGLPIPIWALGGMAARGIDLDDPHREFVGREALQCQRDEVAAAKTRYRGQGCGRRVPGLIRRLAVLDSSGSGPGHNPVRQGHRVYAGDEPVGWVTSGTVVPYWRLGGGPPGGGEPGRRAIALAYVDAALGEADAKGRVSVDKGRGPRLPAQLVRTHLRTDGDRVRAVLYPREELA